MKIIKIEQNSNGSHNNQTGSVISVPEGWAVIPDVIAIPSTFPYVNIEVAEIDGVMTVTSMTEGVVPTPEPEPEPEPTSDEILNLLLGVSE